MLSDLKYQMAILMSNLFSPIIFAVSGMRCLMH